MLAADTAANPTAKRVYEGACAGMPRLTGASPVIPFAKFDGHTCRQRCDRQTNVAQVIIGGGQRHYPRDSDNMPPFGSTYSDAEIASVANYATARFRRQGSEPHRGGCRQAAYTELKAAKAA